MDAQQAWRRGRQQDMLPPAGQLCSKQSPGTSPTTSGTLNARAAPGSTR